MKIIAPQGYHSPYSNFHHSSGTSSYSNVGLSLSNYFRNPDTFYGNPGSWVEKNENRLLKKC